jgi:hypothetical protein
VTANKAPQLTIDHVTIAGSSLARLEAVFARAGLATDYGGPHSNRVTHMSLLGFDDGSYIELISFLKAGQYETAFWGEQIAGDAGPCAWAVQSMDIVTETNRLANQGITVDGPSYFNRQRPDGELVEWRLTFVGDKTPGATLPFIIQDITPRRLRVRPSDSVAAVDGEQPLLTGVKNVVLGVRNLTAAIHLFQIAYPWPAPAVQDDPNFGARLAYFKDSPVVLAKPLQSDNWLSNRLKRFDDAPCAFLLGTNQFSDACQQFDLAGGSGWFGYRTAWFKSDRVDGLRLGITS